MARCRTRPLFRNRRAARDRSTRSRVYRQRFRPAAHPHLAAIAVADSLYSSYQNFGSLRRLTRCDADRLRSEEHTSELQSQSNLVCRLLLEKKKKMNEFTDCEYSEHT